MCEGEIQALGLSTKGLGLGLGRNVVKAWYSARFSPCYGVGNPSPFQQVWYLGTNQPDFGISRPVRAP